MKRNIITAMALFGVFFAYNQELKAANNMVEEIAPYVYPLNQPAKPEKIVFMPDGLSYLQANEEKTRIEKYSTANGSLIETVFDVANTRESRIKSFEDFSLSIDGTKMLVYINRQPIYRNSFEAEYYVFDIHRNTLKPLTNDFRRQRSPIFSPDARSVAFVCENNIYIRRLDFDNVIPVTEDGKINEIINGVPDWTYEEEFGVENSMIWSPDSRTLCFIKYNEVNVPTYSFPLYGATCDPLPAYAEYPGIFSYKYPVAGKPNSIVSMHSFDVINKRTKDVLFSTSSVEYIPRIVYATNEQVMAFTLNREQNRLEIFSVNPLSTISKSLIVEQSDTWIQPSAYEKAVVSDRSILLLSARSGYTHLYEYSLNGILTRTLTSGNFDVTDCYGYDSKGNVYIQSTRGGVLNRMVSRVDSKNKITDLSPAETTSSATFSPTKNYFILNTSSASMPPIYTLKSENNNSLRVLEENALLASRVGNFAQKEFTTFSSDGVDLNAYFIKPMDFNPSRRYPVILWQYSGPGSQEVKNSWSLDWQQYAVEQGFIVVCVDPRGTGYRGRDFETIVYRNLGYYETIDQINAAKAISCLPFVDADRIAICGWSYGGYETLMAVTDSASPFAAAVAIAPVTDWLFYDTVYTERYMLTPQANDTGYELSAPLNRTKNLRCPLLIMSGTADDNVHLSNTMEFVSRLQNDGLLCDMLLFPNMHHSINGCNARALVYAKMIEFFKKNL